MTAGLRIAHHRIVPQWASLKRAIDFSALPIGIIMTFMQNWQGTNNFVVLVDGWIYVHFGER